ncbi:MAG TPA: efflux transporter outer membrane subunit [Phycisphaerae bacterium]|nr:efflux transporter outer membrane subunit [Phycisphaerae bacterium]HRR86416.1 efflux transporter outer membrane subunit [Phycisphaerae bacterium]
MNDELTVTAGSDRGSLAHTQARPCEDRAGLIRAAFITLALAQIVLLSVLGLGCTVGPDYRRPDLPMPAEWSSLQADAAATQPASAPASPKPFAERHPDPLWQAQGPTTRPTSRPCDIGSWWRKLNDPTLDSLIDRAVQSNLDLKIATARVREARAQRNSVAAGLWPQIGAAGSYNYGGGSLNAGREASGGTGLGKQVRNTAVNSAVQSLVNGQGIDPAQIASNAAKQALSTAVNNKLSDEGRVSHRGQNVFQAGFDASWELDVFGGVRRGLEAADAEVVASVEDQRAVIVSLVAEVALEYVQLRGYQRRLAIAHKNIEAQRKTVELTQDRRSVGFTNDLEVAQARTQLATTTSQVPVLQDSVRQTMYRLSILLGLPPGALVPELEEASAIPTSPPEVPIGLPSELLRRRPDVSSAERQLAAATARIGEAIADLFPKFSITGSFGTQSRDIRYMLDRDSLVWSLGPAVSWPIFQGGRIRANIEIQNARQEQALAAYEQTVLNALNEVEAALSAYLNEQIRRQALLEAVETSRQATELSTRLYVRGLGAFLNVLEAQRSLYATEEALVQSDTAIITDLIALYKALGGGWEG